MKLACLGILNLHAEDSADMYRIEIGPGEETVLRTIEELATAIRNGLVTGRSRIYHNASQKWLPIEFHPHYKRALALPERPKSAPAITPLPTAVPDFAMKREATRPSEQLTPAPPRPEPVAAQASQPRPSRPSIPLPPAAENLPFIEVEEPKVEPATPVAIAPQPLPPEPLPAPVPVAPPLPAPVALKPALAADAFPSLVRPRSYLPPELIEHEPAGERTREPAHEPAREPEPIAEAAPLPSVSSLPVASRRARRGGKPILAGAGALAAIFVGYLFVTSSDASSEVPAETAPAAEQSSPKPSPADDQDLPPEDTDIPVPRPSAVTKAPPRSGPPSQAWSSSAGATAPLLPTGPARSSAGAAEGIAPDPAITPPPANVELSVPKLPVADSLAPKAQHDTAGLKRILKAVGGQ